MSNPKGVMPRMSSSLLVEALKFSDERLSRASSFNTVQRRTKEAISMSCLKVRCLRDMPDTIFPLPVA